MRFEKLLEKLRRKNGKILDKLREFEVILCGHEIPSKGVSLHLLLRSSEFRANNFTNFDKFLDNYIFLVFLPLK